MREKGWGKSHTEGKEQSRKGPAGGCRIETGTLSRKDEKGSAIPGLTCFRKRNLRNMFKKESCSLQKSGKQFKESNQKKVTLKTPSVPHPPFLMEAQSRAASFWDQDGKPLLSLYLQRNHKKITRKQRMGTTSVLYLLELQSISERVTSFSEGF